MAAQVKASDYKPTQTKRQRLNALRQSMKQERQSFEPTWTDCSDFISPTRARFYTSDVNKGERRNQKIINSTATLAANTLASGMFMGANSGGWLDVCDRNDLLPRASTLNPNYYQHALRMSTGDDRYLQECIVYVPGDHSVTEHEIRNDAFQSLDQTVISCTNITVPNNGSVRISPPATNNRAYIWHENGRC